VLPLVPLLLKRHHGIRLDLQFADGVRDHLLADGIDLAIRVSPQQHPDAVVKRVASTSLVCVGARSYFRRHGLPRTPQDLARHNCLIYNDMREWPFSGPQGRFSVAVQGNLSANTVEAILSAVRAGVGIGLFNRASLVGEMRHPDIVTVLDAYLSETRDVSLVWPRRRFIPQRVRVVTEFFTAELASRI
jgi:DNA-binding transcriptional LysR family regulator